ncbi:MAG TPA: RodZ domain-containing protein [Thermomonas sp.]|nr:RodZ domain-containing protein [Thermomonas sp.]
MTSTPDPDQSHQSLAGCGERLRRAREAAGLSVDEVAARLHMPGRVVKSLEAEDWSRLGAPVFVRGQVRSYSRLLGLTTAPMMAALDIGPVEPSTLVSRTHTPKAQWWAEQIGRRLVYIILTLSLAVPAWVATRQHLSGGNEGTAPLDAPAGPAPHAAKPQAVAPASPRTVVASMAPVATAPSVQAPPVGDIVLRTSAESWLEVTSPTGATVEKGLLPAGSERRYAATQVGRLTLGNASAAQLEHQGRAVDLGPFSRANVARFAVSSDGSLVAAD